MILTLYGLVTLFLIIAFVGLCIWAYTPSRRKRFDQDANIPFVEESSNNSATRRVQQ